MAPTSVVAVMVCADAVDCGTLTLVLPATVLAVTRYWVVTGTCKAMPPALASAVSVRGAAVKEAVMPPTSMVKLAVLVLMAVASMRPASTFAVTIEPASPDSRIAPVAVVAVTDTVLGTEMINATPQITCAGQE